MSGFQRQPFSMRGDKETPTRMPKELVQRYVVKPKEVTERICEEIHRIRLERTVHQSRASINVEQIKSSDKRRSASNAAIVGKDEVILSAKSEEKKGKSAALARRKKPKEPEPRFTLIELTKASYSQIAKVEDKTFNPVDLISHFDDDNDNSEAILQKFRSPSKSVVATGGKGEHLSSPMKEKKTVHMKSMYVIILRKKVDDPARRRRL